MWKGVCYYCNPFQRGLRKVKSLSQWLLWEMKYRYWKLRNFIWCIESSFHILFQRVVFNMWVLSVLQVVICVNVFLTAHIFASPHRLSSLPYPTNSNIQSFPAGWCSFFDTKNYITLDIFVPKYSQKKYRGLCEVPRV